MARWPSACLIPLATFICLVGALACKQNARDSRAPSATPEQTVHVPAASSSAVEARGSRVKRPPECRDRGGFFCAENRAYCPCAAPPAGSRCCPEGKSCTAMCEASMFSCRYDDCSTDGVIREARCEQGAWQVQSRPCRACPASLSCADTQLCVQWIERSVVAERCVDDPCRGGPVTCDCVGELCRSEPGAACMESEIEGSVVTCLIPYSPGGPGSGGVPRPSPPTR